MQNITMVREFILLGFTHDFRLAILLFLLLSITYILTLMGNTMIIVITLMNHQLHTPMYFFLRHFAILEVGFTTTVIPKALANIALGHKTISLQGCFTQSFLYFVLGTMEFILLAVMSMDRYLAICNPLHYPAIMTDRTCSWLVLCSWVGGLLLIMGPSAILFHMPFCGPNTINHFFCDSGPLIKLVCVDTSLLEFIDLLTATLSLFGSLAINIVSYANIISTIFHIPSTTGRQKAFSTCVSHITVVSITYGSCIFMYIKPSGAGKIDLSKAAAVLNTVVSPLLNPFIYCLRNKQVQGALRDTFRMCTVVFKNPP
ncbi:olfactory receptor 49-like [Varanus komodoensis]|uniref:olfactory receptor 49-like n=1 Tax=Varanus komodoensis TaxID=61221 RepID=UPI001CF7D785|nr:olfactory receptor 49-like [Varanus komodoensis]